MTVCNLCNLFLASIVCCLSRGLHLLVFRRILADLLCYFCLFLEKRLLGTGWTGTGTSSINYGSRSEVIAAITINTDGGVHAAPREVGAPD